MSGLRLGAAAALAVLALTGCGGNAERNFQRHDLRPVQIEIERSKSALSARLRTVRLGNRSDAGALRAQIGGLDARVQALGRLTPPDGLRPAFRRYTRANQRLVRELELFATALGGRNARALEQASARAQVAVAAIVRAQSDLNAQVDGHS